MRAASSFHARSTAGGTMLGCPRSSCTTARTRLCHSFTRKRRPGFCLAATCAPSASAATLFGRVVTRAPCIARASSFCEPPTELVEEQRLGSTAREVPKPVVAAQGL